VPTARKWKASSSYLFCDFYLDFLPVLAYATQRSDRPGDCSSEDAINEIVQGYILSIHPQFHFHQPSPTMQLQLHDVKAFRKPFLIQENLSKTYERI